MAGLKLEPEFSDFKPQLVLLKLSPIYRASGTSRDQGMESSSRTVTLTLDMVTTCLCTHCLWSFKGSRENQEPKHQHPKDTDVQAAPGAGFKSEIVL